MYDDQDDQGIEQDFFTDGDMANPENLPEGTGYVGKITAINWIDKQGEVTSGPDIEVNILTVAKPTGEKFGPNDNYFLSAKVPFWKTGEYAVNSRRQLRKLLQDVLALDDETLTTTPLKDNVNKLVGQYVTYDVKYRKFTAKDGSEGTSQDFKKVKAASQEQVVAVI